MKAVDMLKALGYGNIIQNDTFFSARKIDEAGNTVKINSWPKRRIIEKVLDNDKATGEADITYDEIVAMAKLVSEYEKTTE